MKHKVGPMLIIAKNAEIQVNIIHTSHSVTDRQTDAPEYMRVPMESAHTCPVRSTSMHELIAVTRGF